MRKFDCGWFAALAVLLLACGCAGVKSVYTEVPTDGVALVDYEGELKPEEFKGKSVEELLKTRTAEGYRLVGKAEFSVSGNQGWTDAMVKKGREIKAAKIDYVAIYDQTESGSAGQDAVAAALATGPGYESCVSDQICSTTAGRSASPYSLGIDCYVYHVYYFKKVK